MGSRRRYDEDEDFLDKAGSTDGLDLLKMRNREEEQKVQAKIEEKFRERKQKTRERSRMMFREKLHAVRTERGSPTKPDPASARRGPTATTEEVGARHPRDDDDDDERNEKVRKNVQEEEREREHKERESGPSSDNDHGTRRGATASDDESDDDRREHVARSPSVKSPRPTYLADLSSSDVPPPPPPPLRPPSGAYLYLYPYAGGG
jgi:hypothetical protein